MGFASPSTSSRVLTVTRNENPQVSGNAVLNQPVTRNSGNVNLRVAPRGTLNQNTYTTVEGVSEERLSAILGSIADMNRESGGATVVIPASGGTSTPSAPTGIGAALDDRLADNIATGSPSEQGELGVGNWVLIAGGAVVLLVVLWIVKRKKKT